MKGLKPCAVLDGMGLSNTFNSIKASACNCPNRAPSPAIKALVDAIKEGYVTHTCAEGAEAIAAVERERDE